MRWVGSQEQPVTLACTAGQSQATCMHVGGRQVGSMGLEGVGGRGCSTFRCCPAHWNLCCLRLPQAKKAGASPESVAVHAHATMAAHRAHHSNTAGECTPRGEAAQRVSAYRAILHGAAECDGGREDAGIDLAVNELAPGAGNRGTARQQAGRQAGGLGHMCQPGSQWVCSQACLSEQLQGAS